MADAMDYYDVQAMIRDARSEINGEISRAVTALRMDTGDALDELRADVIELGKALRDAVAEVASLQRVLNSRTEHLA